MFSLFISLNTCTIYILSSVYVQYIYRIIVHSFFKFQRCEHQEKTMRIREAGKRKVWLYYNLLISLVNCLCCCYMYNRDVCYTELWRMIVLIVPQNRKRPRCTKSLTVCSRDSRSCWGEEFRGGQSRELHVLKRFKDVCVCLCVWGGGRRKWYMTSSKLFHVSYFFHPMHGSLFNLMSLPHLQKKGN